MQQAAAAGAAAVAAQNGPEWNLINALVIFHLNIGG
jgi:hypothetical protein